MKEWARSFYESKAWKDTRAAFLTSKRWICERCKENGTYNAAEIAHHRVYLTRQNISDPNVALAWSNLEALCQDCHNKEHHAKVCGRRYRIDAQGNAIPPIHGEPSGG